MNAGFLFIPDISGFTKFVNETELKHSQHIIQELLELLIEANQLNLVVSEIEGDAILFYRMGAPPALGEVIAQCEKMFIDFHAHLQQYERDRLCNCGACSTAHQLSLKMIMNYGELSTVKIKHYEKLMGADVILAHRLLKNNLMDIEYALMSDNYLQALGEKERCFEDKAVKLKSSSMDYPDIGNVSYQYFSLTPYLERIPPPKKRPEPERTGYPVTLSEQINAPLEKIYKLVTDPGQRMQWIAGIKALHYEQDKVHRLGTGHQCVLQKGQFLVEAAAKEKSKDRVEYVESTNDFPQYGKMVMVYIMEEEGNTTRFSIEFHLPAQGLLDKIKAFFIKAMIRKNGRASLLKLKQLAEAAS